MNTEFPKWMYGPNGEAGIFANVKDIPEGWKDTPAAFEQSAKDNAVSSKAVGNVVVADSKPGVHEVKQKVAATASSATAIGEKTVNKKK